ncbi:unannotated protein [freshwater metagenome]|uniref:Unannotated protein n=1 Tax=freshwater metagenome TaxID=449393 RepID=A0A6J6UNB5_9ZZZZ
MAAPPSVAGASQSKLTCPACADATKLSGLLGATGVHGVHASETSDGSLVPIALRALTRNLCATPSVRPVIVRSVPLPCGSGHVVQDVPSLMVYSIT